MVASRENNFNGCAGVHLSSRKDEVKGISVSDWVGYVLYPSISLNVRNKGGKVLEAVKFNQQIPRVLKSPATVLGPI